MMPTPPAVESATNWITFHPAAAVAIAALGVAIIASLADRRRSRRTDINRIGFMPWQGVFMCAMFVSFGALIYALKG